MDAGIQAAKEKTSAALDATNPDLSAFREHGGKLILYHGWDDPAIPALNTVNYYGEVVEKMGRNSADAFLRLYMLPGVQHCANGPGLDNFGQSTGSVSIDPEHNVRIALENWAEKGTAPSTLIVSGDGGRLPGGPVAYDASAVSLSSVGTVQRHGSSVERGQLRMRRSE